MADFTPKKVKEPGKAKSGQGPAIASTKDAEHQSPPVLHLDHGHLEKLMPKGSGMPPIGSKVRISGLAHVGAASENQDEMSPAGKGKVRRSMTLHLHQMDMGQDGITEGEKEESQKDGMKSEIDKALSQHAGSEAAKGKPKGKTPTPRGGQD